MTLLVYVVRQRYPTRDYRSGSIINAGPDQTVCAADTLFLHATLSGVANQHGMGEKNVAFGTL